MFVFAIPWEYSLDFGQPIGNIARLAGLAVAAVTLLAVAQKGRIQRFSPQHWAILGFFLWTCASAVWSLDPITSLTRLPGYAQELMVFALAWELVDSAEDWLALLRSWLAGSWVLALLTLASLFTLRDDTQAQARFYATGQDPNDVARFLCLCLPVAALAYALDQSRAGRLFSGGYFFVSLAAVVATASRGGILAALVGLMGSAYVLRRRLQPRWWAIASAGIAAAVLVWLIPPETYLRIFTITDQFSGGDLNQRTVIWSWGWSAFERAPLLGHGAGTFVAAAGLAPFDTAHNTFLSVLVEYGIAGLALFILILILALQACHRLEPVQRAALFTMVAIWLISALVGTVAESRSTWLMFGVIAVADRLHARISITSTTKPVPVSTAIHGEPTTLVGAD